MISRYVFYIIDNDQIEIHSGFSALARIDKKGTYIYLGRL